MSKVKIFISFNSDKLSGKLTKFFTGCYAYHVGFAVPESKAIYDMNLLFRKIPLKEQYVGDKMFLFDLPPGVNITEQDLQDEINRGVADLCDNGSMLKNLYGFVDYLAYGFRWVYHLFGKSTPNFQGVICSEKVNDLLIKHGWDSPFKYEVPSPCDFAKYFSVQDWSN